MSKPTQRALLRHLYSGGTAAAFLKEHNEDRGLIDLWKKEDPKFAESYDEAICATRTSHHDGSLEAREPEWQDAFLVAYRELGHDASIAAAHRLLKKRGFSFAVGAIYARLSKSNPQHDEQFESRFLNAEAQRLAPIEEKLQHQMAAGEIPSIAYKHLQTHKLTKDRYQPPTQRVEKSLTKHTIDERRLTLRQEFIDQSRTMFGKEVKDVSRVTGETAEVERQATDVGGHQESGDEAQPSEGDVDETEVVEEEEVAV